MTARILIVDDVPANSRLLEARLAAEYYQVATAANGADALRMAQLWQPDLILLDVMMPQMNGFECCSELKRDRRTMHIPVVMTTSLSAPGERVRGLEAGADDFLTKPMEFETLLARVKGLVRLRRLLDEWRARDETAHDLGLVEQSENDFVIAGANAVVIEDREQDATLIADALARDGIRSVRDMDGLARPLDLIVLSLSLAREDPLALASRLMAEDTTRNVPMLLIAETAQRRTLLRGFDLGANDWLQRPIDANELRARARNQIRRKHYQDSLRNGIGLALRMALLDPLTGLYNRRYLLRHLDSLLEKHAATSVAVLLIDLDSLKVVNDSYGHAAGDAALRAVAGVLREGTRVFDTLARLGGDEFALVMPGTESSEALTAAERLRLAIAAIVFTPAPDTRVSLTVSVGVACGRPSGEGRAAALLNLADDALYAAKDRGRNIALLAGSMMSADTSAPHRRVLIT